VIIAASVIDGINRANTVNAILATPSTMTLLSFSYVALIRTVSFFFDLNALTPNTKRSSLGGPTGNTLRDT
jgi:hypothetical protein